MWQQWWKRFGDKVLYDVQKYGFIAIFGGVIAALWFGFRSWFAALPIEVQIIIGIVATQALVILILAVSFVRLRRQLKTDPPMNLVIGQAELLRTETKTIAPAKAEAATAPDPVSIFSKHLKEIIELKPDVLKLKVVEHEYGAAIAVENLDHEKVTDCEVMLVALGRWNEDKHRWNKPDFEPRKFIAMKTIQPDQGTTATNLARYENVQKTKLALAEGIHNPTISETRGGTWRAKFKVSANGQSRMENVYFSWEPGQTPRTIIPSIAMSADE